jgi:hypothetical protein
MSSVSFIQGWYKRTTRHDGGWISTIAKKKQQIAGKTPSGFNILAENVMEFSRFFVIFFLGGEDVGCVHMNRSSMSKR